MLVTCNLSLIRLILKDVQKYHFYGIRTNNLDILAIMKWVSFFILFSLISCKRNHTNVLIRVFDNENNSPVAHAKIEVFRKGKKGLAVEKEPLLIHDAYTNEFGEVMVNFKYDRGNTYALYVYAAAGYFQNSRYDYFDLEKGKNEKTIYLYQQSYIKLHLISNFPNAKVLDVRIDDFTSVYHDYYFNSTLINKSEFCRVNSTVGNKTLTWKVDSAGIRKNYSLPIQLKGHDTTYATINF